ncbi:MAG TPA: alpha/beta hydrolase [Ktedonobacterales bacterium]|jgi:dienelactone hydrolase|nr:alpha/beta hydrolase [Ktedonobacterales bacterium]
MLDPSVFQYDHDAPVELKVLSERDQDGFAIRDIRYASPRGGSVPAYLVCSSSHAPQAGVIFGHWGEGDRREFVDEAVLLAGLGLVSLCIDAPFRRPTDQEPALVEIPRGDAQWVVDVRRGVDLLTDEFHLPIGRLGYVGHSYSATLGGAVAGVEHRITAHVLMAGEPALSEWMLNSPHPALVHERETTPPDEYRAYLAALAPLDARHYIGNAAPSHLFFQFARQDEYLTPDRGDLYFALASEPKRVTWYDSKHAFNGAARRDRAIFLCEQLGVAPPSQHVLNLLEHISAPTAIEDPLV